MKRDAAPCRQRRGRAVPSQLMPRRKALRSAEPPGPDDAVLPELPPRPKTPYAKGQKPLAAIEAHQRTRYTLAETREQEQLVEALLTQGLSERSVHVRLAREFDQGRVPWKLTGSRVKTLVGRTRDRWRKEDALEMQDRRAEQIRRLHKGLALALTGQRDAQGAWVHRPSLGNYARIEELLARVQGTLEPIQVNVDVRYTEAMIQVIGSMGGDELSDLLAQAQETEQLAARYREEHPMLAAPSTIDVAAE